MIKYNFDNLRGTFLNYKIQTYNTTFNYIVLRKNKEGKYYIAYQLFGDLWSEHPFHKILKWPSKRQKKKLGDVQTFSSEIAAKVVIKRILKYSSNYPRKFVLSDCTYLGILALVAIALTIILI